MSIPISPNTRPVTIDGPAGRLEAAIDAPVCDAALSQGVAVIGHPHPLYGGTMDNKVVQTIARALLQLGYTTLRFNFRGIGASEGAWDEGDGEKDDMMAVVGYARNLPEFVDKPQVPLVLAGFSFGSYIASQVAEQLAQSEAPAQRLILVGVAASRFSVAHVPGDSLVIHGEQDEVVPLAAVMDWARPQHMPVVVIPGVGHYFHGQLPLLKNIIIRNWQP